MKVRLLICTVLLAFLAAPAFADSITLTNKGGLVISPSGISANSVITSLAFNGTTVLTGNLGSLQFDTGTFTGSLKNGGSFTGGNFSFGLSGSATVFESNFAGTLTKIGKGLYDLAGTFSGTVDGIHFIGTTNQIFGFARGDDGRECFRDLNGTTTITATAAVPEPGTLTFFGTGLIALAGAVRRKLVARA